MMRVTRWYVKTKDNTWRLDHTEDGWVTDLDMPTATNDYQKVAWAGKKWKPVYAFKTSDGLVSEKAACFAALRMSALYDYVPNDNMIKTIERKKRK